MGPVTRPSVISIFDRSPVKVSFAIVSKGVARNFGANHIARNTVEEKPG
jgi:hypothetical protein